MDSERAVKRETADQELYLQAPSACKPRRAGPWRCIEVFVWACAVTQMAFKRGWDTYQPVTTPDFDVGTDVGRRDAHRYLVEVNPDLVVFSPPCTVWSQMQNANQRTLCRVRELRRRR